VSGVTKCFTKGQEGGQRNSDHSYLDACISFYHRQGRGGVGGGLDLAPRGFSATPYNPRSQLRGRLLEAEVITLVQEEDRWSEDRLILSMEVVNLSFITNQIRVPRHSLRQEGAPIKLPHRADTSLLEQSSFHIRIYLLLLQGVVSMLLAF